MMVAAVLAAALIVPCDDQLLPRREIKGQRVGPASCLMQESDVTADGRAVLNVYKTVIPLAAVYNRTSPGRV